MDGLELAVSACKEQFQWDLWNCPVTANSIVSKATHSRGRCDNSIIYHFL